MSEIATAALCNIHLSGVRLVLASVTTISYHVCYHDNTRDS